MIEELRAARFTDEAAGRLSWIVYYTEQAATARHDVLIGQYATHEEAVQAMRAYQAKVDPEINHFDAIQKGGKA